MKPLDPASTRPSRSAAARTWWLSSAETSCYLYKQSPTYWGRKASPAVPYVNETGDRCSCPDRSAQEAAFYGGQLDRWVPSPVAMRSAKQRLGNNYFFYERPGFYNTNYSFNMTTGAQPAVAH